jgi:maleylacetate reductase
MSLTFDHVTLAQRIVFESGRAADNLAAEVKRLGASRVMVVASGAHVDAVVRVTSGFAVTLLYTDVAQHVPTKKAHAARAAAHAYGIDLIVCIGGGSTIGLAKAVALTTGIPIVAVPTTYSGSEGTNVWGLTTGSRKQTGVDDRVLPVTVIYDAALTLSLPVRLSVASGLNALAHCVDSLWAPRTDPINQTLAVNGVRGLAAGLRTIKEDPHQLLGREQTLYGAYLSAVAFASAGAGIHHKICHVLGGTFGMPHAQTHAAVLPYVVQFNAPAAPEAERTLAEALSAETALTGLEDLYAALEAPRSLKEAGLEKDSIPEAARRILAAVPATNPRSVTQDNLEELLRSAWAGDRTHS